MSSQTSQLHSYLVSMLDRSTLDQIAIHTSMEDPKAQLRAVHHSLGPILERMGSFAGTAKGEDALSQSWAQLASTGTGGRDLADHIFDDDLHAVAKGLAEKGGISLHESVATIEATCAWALTTCAASLEDPNDSHALAQLLISSGTSGVGVSSAAPDTAKPAAAVASYPEPTVDPVAATAESGTVRMADAKGTSGASGGISPKLIGAGLAALLFVVIGTFALRSGGDGSAADAELVTTEPPAELAMADDAPRDDTSSGDDAESEAATTLVAESNADDNATTTSATETVAAPAETTETADAVSPSVTTLQVPMRDIREFAPAATGIIDFSFDVVTGQICFEVGSIGVNPPYSGHIHAGDYGVKGGVVVDLGVLEDGDTGCIDNLPADTLAILAKPSRHYAELHDAGGEWTVRGQLSETVDNPGIIPYSIPMRDILGTSPTANGVLNFDFNTLTGEICYSVVAVGVEPPFASHIHAGDFGVKGGVVLDLGGLSTGNEGCTKNPIADTVAILSNPAGHYAELHDVSGDWTVRGQLTETVENPGIVSLAVPMVDITDSEPSAAGTLTFDFDTVTGEVCFDVSATNIAAPFNTHIHAGDFGVKGGVVLDMGERQDGSFGCVDNAIGDTLAVLADPSGHYAELHDAGGEWTIRGQLSEASTAIDPDSTNLLIDTDGGGATIRLESGKIFLEGEVGSQAVAYEMLSGLTGSTTPVIDNLSIVPGSPLPSGRVIIADAVFFETGSDLIKELPASTVTALVELADSRPDWVMTIVGHTDNIGSDVYNLELSLSRAEALRDVLIAEGMNSETMRIRGAGETAPIADNATEPGRAQNRRIEFEFSPA